ncbi:hypothetical protein [Levilactobacillus brevis]|uniref:hypothetical protein n=1 Tax=Levilactobacillus brevis TaxID=1580 RepID=UPI000B3E6A83|nr:hypothetical protein [Levilactobacillus brevis]ARW50539.1 hypothetical protein S101106_01056 [Levilactobacillus brevis]
MADSSRTIMTDAGFALETRVRADETKMQFTRATISTDDHFSDTDDALAKLTELSNIQQDGKVTAVQVINTTTVYVQVDVNQAESKADYQMRSAALYAKDDDGTEVLYGVTVLQDPVFVHKDADGSYLGFGINTTVGRASNVVVVVDPANMVTQQVFESTMKNYYTKAEIDAKFVTDDDFASKLPKNIATTDAANTFAKSQTLAGGATDGKGNAYATTKDVATGLNNGLSTKVTDNKNGTITVNSLTYDLPKTGITPIDARYSGSFNDLPLGTVFASNIVTDGPDKTHAFTTTTFSFNSWNPGRKAQIAIADSANLMYFRVYTGASWQSWTLLSDDSKVVHSADMRKPANDVAGIEEVNTKQDKIGYTPADDSKVVHATDTSSWQKSKVTNDAGGPLLMLGDTDDLSAKIAGLPNGYFTIYCTGKTLNNPSASPKRGIIHITASKRAGSGILFSEDKNAYIITMLLGTVTYTKMADDSKVAHLSGANNFDTVPTVNNNPLLLASSLPSDLARTGQDANFTGKLQQNGQDVALANNTIARNPNTGVVSEPVDFTKLTVNGGKSVATSDDLKSVADKAWYQLDNKYITPASGYTLAPSTSILYKIDDSNHKLYLSGSIALTDSDGYKIPVTVQLGSIIKSIKNFDVPYFGYYNSNVEWNFVRPSQSGTNLTFLSVLGLSSIAATTGTGGCLAYVTYDELI